MLRILAVALAVAFAAPAAFAKDPAPRGGEPNTPDQPRDDHIVYYEADDAGMSVAIAEARRWLPDFLAAFGVGPANEWPSYSLKVGLPDATGGTEHIWVDSLRFEGYTLVGALANHPVNLPGMSLGSRIAIDQAQVSDWMIVRGDRAYGGYTLRVMLEDLPQAEAAALRAFLAQDPVPPDWRP